MINRLVTPSLYAELFRSSVNDYAAALPFSQKKPDRKQPGGTHSKAADAMDTDFSTERVSQDTASLLTYRISRCHSVCFTVTISALLQ